jgi:hypothetical protein
MLICHFGFSPEYAITALSFASPVMAEGGLVKGFVAVYKSPAFLGRRTGRYLQLALPGRRQYPGVHRFWPHRRGARCRGKVLKLNTLLGRRCSNNKAVNQRI